jgi:predicted nuclease with RNAse H fold
MRTLGIDLAAQAKGTFLCELRWEAGAASIVELRENHAHAADDDLCEHIAREGLAIVGVDVPFGWPDDFVALMAGGCEVRSWQDRGSESLRLRATDLACRQPPLSMTPMSVTMDRIAAPAMRWRLLARKLTAVTVQRVEVYPAAALKTWGLPHQGYKRPEQENVRAQIFRALSDGLRLRPSAEHAALLRDRADALDALVAALVARAVGLGRTTLPPAALAEIAAREGWIHVPSCSLRELC